MTDYNALKATELKDLLKERGIPQTGLTRKQQYIEALEAHDAQPDTADADDATPDQPEPVAADEAPAEPSQEEQPDQSDSLKRKRRSPTPTLDSESTQKKLKSADSEELAKLPEDFEKDAPVPIEASADETTKPMPVSDDVMDVTGQDEVKDADIEKAAQDVQDQEVSAAPREASAEPMAVDAPEPLDVENTGPASKYPPTSALYVRNLLRPLQIPPFREHLLQLATPADQPLDDSLIDTVHLDTFKSHAFVLFTSTSAAIRARNGLHDRIWPEETQRKALWVDFVPPEQAQSWISTELEAGKSKRFEVVYSTSSEGEPTVSLEEASQQQHSSNPASSSSAAVPGPGMPNAPTGPRGDRAQASAPAQPQSYAPRKPRTTSASLSHFPSTTANPKIFFQPVSPTLVDKRLEELDRETSRDWDGGRQKPLGTALDQLRRYTFEDGDVVVDGGVDFGGFGRDRGAGGGAGHGGGGRRRGGGGRRR